MSALTPREALADGPTRTLLALCLVYMRDGRATVRSVAAERGRSISMIHGHLTELRDHDLVSHDRGTAGTLRPLVEAVD